MTTNNAPCLFVVLLRLSVTMLCLFVVILYLFALFLCHLFVYLCGSIAYRSKQLEIHKYYISCE